MVNTITVLLSTYNGEKYLEEQIKSLLAQEGVELCVVARDDGSKDKTLEILEHYSKIDSRFTYYSGENIGPAKSFLNLICNAPISDYYAFCDQDDVWDTDKLFLAISHLQRLNNDVPNCYYSNLRIVDANLNYYRLSHEKPLVQNSKYSALVEDVATGCTLVFNRIVVEYISNRMPQQCSMHDAWVYLVCKFFGNVVYDFNAHISYRQHGNNVVGTYLGKKTVSIYVSRIKRLFDRTLQPRFYNSKSFLACYNDILKKKDKEKIEEIVYYKDSLKRRIKFLLDKDIYASSFSRDIRNRFLILIGII